MPVPVAVYTNLPRAGEGLTTDLQPEYEGAHVPLHPKYILVLG